MGGGEMEDGGQGKEEGDTVRMTTACMLQGGWGVGEDRWNKTASKTARMQVLPVEVPLEEWHSLAAWHSLASAYHDWHPEGHGGDEHIDGHEGSGRPTRSERRGDEMR